MSRTRTPRARRRARLVASSALLAVVGALLPATAPAASAAPGGDRPGKRDQRPALVSTDPDAAALSNPVADPVLPGRGNPLVDVLRYDLDVRWTPRTALLEGTATVRFRAVRAARQVTLDLSDALRVTAVHLDERRARWSRSGDRLVVATRPLVAGSRHDLVIRYRGTPQAEATSFRRPDVRRLGWQQAGREVWTVQQPYGAYTWYPVNDHPSDAAFYQARISTPRPLTGVLAAELVDRHARDGRTVTSWRSGRPVAPYLVTLAIGDYVRHAGLVTGMPGRELLPVSHWLPRGRPGLLAAVRRIEPALRWLAARLGPWPGDVAGVVAVPGRTVPSQGLAMVSRKVLAGPPAPADLALVEALSRQWYGGTVAPRDWSELWLVEGWVTHAGVRYDVAVNRAPLAAYQRALRDADADFRELYGPPGDYDVRDFGQPSVTYGGALLLERLRARVGERAFDRLRRGWPERYAGEAAGRTDFGRFASRTAGRDLLPFLRTWLTSPTTPR